MTGIQKKIADYIIARLETTDIHNIKVKQLTTDLKIGRSTFYTYYDSTFSVLQHIEDEFFDEFLTFVSGFWSMPLDRKYFKTPHPHMVKGFYYLSEHRKIPAVLWGPYGDMRFQFKCKKTIEDIFYPPEIARIFYPLNTKYHIHYVVGGHLDTLNHWIQNDCPISPEELALFMYEKMFSDVINTLYPDDRKIAAPDKE
jgi:hypothetical protein